MQRDEIWMVRGKAFCVLEITWRCGLYSVRSWVVDIKVYSRSEKHFPRGMSISSNDWYSKVLHASLIHNARHCVGFPSRGNIDWENRSCRLYCR